MSKVEILHSIKAQVQELMGTLSIGEIMNNGALIQQIEIVLGLLAKVT